MSIQTLSMIYNALFIVVLIGVCALFSVIHLHIYNKLRINYWILTTCMFAAICFLTIIIWHRTIGFIT